MNNGEPILPVEGIDFDFVETDNHTLSSMPSRNPIVALHEKYAGIIVQYGKIGILVEEVPPRVQFDFAILNAGDFDQDFLENSASFKNHLGDIIFSTIEKMAKENASRNNNSKITD